MSYFAVKSGRRNPEKHDWRGYVPRGAVKAELTRDGQEYEGLPVPDRLISMLGGTTPDHYALAVDDLEHMGLLVAVPLGKRQSDEHRRRIDVSRLETAVAAIGKASIPHSLRIPTLHVLPEPHRVIRDRHERGDVIKTPQHFFDSMLSQRDMAITTVRLPREVNDAPEETIPGGGISEPYFSVFFDTVGTLLYFIIHPRDYHNAGLPVAEGIVRSSGYTWVRDRPPHSLARFGPDDFMTHTSEESDRPLFPETMSAWLNDEDLP